MADGRTDRPHRRREAARGGALRGRGLRAGRRALARLLGHAEGARADRGAHTHQKRPRSGVLVAPRASFGRPGAGAVRATLAALDPTRGRPQIELEWAFARLARELGLPPCQRGGLVDIAGGERLDLREMDVWLPVPRLLLELDGRAFRELGRAPARDSRRDRRLLAAGVRTMRASWIDVDHHRAELARDLPRAHAQRVVPA